MLIVFISYYVSYKQVKRKQQQIEAEIEKFLIKSRKTALWNLKVSYKKEQRRCFL